MNLICFKPELINLIGLSANMFGVALVFKFGYPQPSHEKGVGRQLMPGTVLQDGTTVAQRNVQVGERRDLYLRWSRGGLFLMIIGFALQFVSTWQNWK